ncbi:MAG TPA: acyltransferase [Tepidisphaeraceae bacterium]|jgi:fucose 4-O-acetylase-like acetyltransferase|nr:acyltransferase [Tepidisphaeraceae bacterium]
MPQLAVAPELERSDETILLTPPRAPRNQMLDAARGLGCIGVIWVHTVIDSPDLARAAALARFGTAFFAIAAIFFLLHGLSSKASDGITSYALQRFRRLYLPFLVWSLIYMILRNGKRLLLTDDGLVLLGPSRLLLGTARHLWFLPFILMACIACYPLRSILTRLRFGRLIIAFAFAAIGLVVARIRCPDLPRLEPYIGKFYLNAWMFLPGVLWGIALASLHPLLPRKLTATPLIAILGLAILIGATTWLWFVSEVPFVDSRSVPSLPRNLSGLGLLLVALYPLRSRLLSPLAAFGRTTYGVYLVHLLFVDPLQLLARHAHLGRHWWLDIPTFLLSVLLSYLLVRLLRSSKFSSWLIP